MTGAPRYVAGIGCRAEASADDIAAAVHAASVACGLAPAVRFTLACIPARASQPGLRQAAARLGLPIVVASDAALCASAGRCLSRSEASLRATGLASASEAAALAVAGPGSRLLAARSAYGGATCAIAVCAATHRTSRSDRQDQS